MSENRRFEFRYVKRHKLSRIPVCLLGFRDAKSAMIGIPITLGTFLTTLLATGNIIIAFAVTLPVYLAINIIFATKNRNVKIYKAKKNFKIEIVPPEEVE